MIFDSHAHLIADDIDRYPPSPLTGKLRPGDLDDPVTAERLLHFMDENGVEKALVVQRAHVYGYDSSYVCDSAAKYPDRLAAVVAIDAEDPGVLDRIAYWVQERGAIGIRLAATKMVAGETAWFTDAHNDAVWRTAADLGVPICVHLFRPQRLTVLAGLKPLLAKYPQVAVIIDHLSGIGTEAGAPDYGFDTALTDIAAFPNVAIKFSTINFLRLAEQGQPAAAVIRRFIETFGADRLMWGSDIGQSKGTYADMVEMARNGVAMFERQVRDQLLYGVTKRIYG